MPFNVNKCHILHVGTRNQKFDYEMNGVKLDSINALEILAFRLRQNLNSLSNEGKDAASKANRMLGL